MAGNTSRIEIGTLRIQWASHSSYAAICSYWTITKDQLVRLRNVLPLPLRNDRRLRAKGEVGWEPTPAEIAASEASLSLAPMVAARATCESALWTDEIRSQRQVTKPTDFRIVPIEVPEELRDIDDSFSRGAMW